MAFVDLAGFTALTEAHGDDYAADVFDAFVAALTAACAASADVTCVKHLGDGALLVSSSEEAMLGALQEGVKAGDSTDLCLRVRAGVHAGEVLRIETVHGEDVLGHTVNVAARLCGLAAPGELLLSDTVWRAAGSTHATARSLGVKQLRHVTEPVPVWALPFGAADGRIDPVCHMTTGRHALSARIGGRDWLFCSAPCRDRFVSEHG